MATNAPDECSRCREKYNDEERAPRSLPCSHCFCSVCIYMLIYNKRKRCPFCWKRFKANVVQEIGMNTCLLDVLKLMKEKEQNPPALQVTGSASGSKHVSLEELKSGTKLYTQEIIVKYKHFGEQINLTIQGMKVLRDNFLQVVQSIRNEILVKIDKVQKKTNQEGETIEERIKRLEHQMRALREKQSSIEKAVQNLDDKISFTDAAELLDELYDFNSKAQENLNSLTQSTSRDEEALNVFQKAFEGTEAKMNVIREALNSLLEGDDGIQFPLEVQQSRIQDPDPALLPPGSSRKILVPKRALPEQGTSISAEVATTPNGARKHISIADLRERNTAVLRLIMQEKVFVEHEGDHRRYARMTLDNENQIYVHHLRADFLLLPPDAHLLQHDDVMHMVKPSSARRAFLELGTDEESLGRIIINLRPKSKRADNFAALCSGSFGPSYANTVILELDVEEDTVVCGDYESNDGNGGKEVIPGAGEEEGGEWEASWDAGSVRAWGDKASQFGIVLKDNPLDILDTVFGTIDSGLNVVQNAVIGYSDISEVKIIDCGIILP